LGFGSAVFLATDPYMGTEEDYSYDLVQQYMASQNWEIYPVWIDARSSNNDPVAAQNQSLQTSQSTLYQLLSLCSRPCGEALIKFTTAGLFTVSNVIDYNFTDFLFQTVYFPSFPSFSLCQEFVTTCTGFIPDDVISQVTKGSCNQSTTITFLDFVFPPQPQYPKEYSYVIYKDKYIAFLPVTNYPVSPNYVPPCRAPLSWNQKSFATDPTRRACQDKCQSHLAYTQSDWDAHFILLSVFGWLSWLTAIYMVITLSMIPKNRKYPGFMTVFVYVGFMFLNTPFVVISWYGTRGYFVCEDEYTPMGNHGTCTFTLTFLMFGGLIVIFFWTLMSVNTYLSISLRMSLDPQLWGAITIGIGIGIPIAAVIVGANINFEFLPFFYFCFIFVDWYVWIFWQIPLVVGLCVNLYCCAFVLYEIRNIRDSSKGKRGKIFKIIRILGFLFCFFEVAAFIFSFNCYSVSAHKDDYEAVLHEYATCLYTNQPVCERPPSGVGAPSVATWLVFVIQIAGCGAITFLILGTTNQVLWFWCRRLKGEEEESSTGSSSISKASWAAAGGGGGGGGEEDSYDPDQ